MSFLKRIEKVQIYLISEEIDFLIIEDPINLLYLTGMHLEIGQLIVGQNKAKLFVDQRFIEEATTKGTLLVSLMEEKPIAEFFLGHAKGKKIKIAIDSDHLTYSAYQHWQEFFTKQSFVSEIIPKAYPLKEIRLIKTQEEILFLKKSASINWQGFKYLGSLLKEGITEKFLALEYELFCRKRGADRLAFDPIICFGANSAMPHHRADETKLKKNDQILIDIGVVVDNYCSDMTRVVFYGNPNPVLEEFYDIVKKAQRKALSLARPGIAIGKLDKIARDYIEEKGYGKDFLHSLGHGVGLEVHEFPRLKFDGKDKDIILKPGMVITIEPGIYKPGTGGVRYEDTIVITNEGYENFYENFYEKEL